MASDKRQCSGWSGQSNVSIDSLRPKKEGSMKRLNRIFTVILIASMAIAVAALFSQCSDDSSDSPSLGGATVTMKMENVR